MTIAVEPLHEIGDLEAAVTLQELAFGNRNPAIWPLPHLLHVKQSGGLVLGARQTRHPVGANPLTGILIDIIADVDGYPARRTVSWAVEASFRNQGFYTRLREAERHLLHREGVDLVFWDVDPLNSVELHIALNKLGGLATAYTHGDSYETALSSPSGVPSDRVRVEWWIDAPRVVSRIVHGAALPHQHVGLHDMGVLTKTTMLQTGVRGLIECDQNQTSDHILVEIPDDYAHVWTRDAAAAIQWRKHSRAGLEQLFGRGYQGVGLIHEGGRSFLVMKNGTRRTELGAVGDR